MGGGSELSDQLLDPDVPTLASQDKLKVSPKGLPFVINPAHHSDTILQLAKTNFNVSKASSVLPLQSLKSSMQA